MSDTGPGDLRSLQARWLALVPLLPVFFMQGFLARRSALRLPDAAPPCDGICGVRPGANPLRVALLGESPVAGVGVSNHAEGLAGQLGETLAEVSGRPVAWRAIGENGATIREVRERLVPRLAEFGPDLVIVVLGVNDTTALTPVSRWKRELSALHGEIRVHGAPLVLFNAVPPMGHFIGVPQPLRGVLGVRSALLDHALEASAKALPDSTYLRPRFPLERACMAEDGYHPSAYGYGLWARQLAEFVGAELLCVEGGGTRLALRPRRPVPGGVPGSAPARSG